MTERKLPNGRVESEGRRFKAIDAEYYLRDIPDTLSHEGFVWYIRPERIPHRLLREIKYRVIERVDDGDNFIVESRIISEVGIRGIMALNDRTRSSNP